MGKCMEKLTHLGQVQNLVPFQIGELVDNSVTDFDLFIALERHLILYSGAGYKWNRDELTSLLKTGHSSLFLHPHDLPLARAYKNIAALPRIERDLAPPERIHSIEQIGMQFVKCLYGGEITAAVVGKSREIAESLVECLREDRHCIKQLSGLGNHDLYTYYHSARVASYTTAMAIQMGLDQHQQLVDIAMGGLMHDVGKKFVGLEIINKAGALTEEEWQQMRSHPKKGLDEVTDSLLGHVPREIILHHHERVNGTGYPDGLDDKSLLMEVKLATIADIFDALTSSRSYQKKRTRYEALDLMKHKLLGQDISRDGFKALISCLAS